MKLGWFLLSFCLGVLATKWIGSQPIFDPFAFKIIEKHEKLFFFEQSIDLPVFLADHVTRVYFKDPKDKVGVGWRYIGKVAMDPFDLDEIKILKNDNELQIQFPWLEAKIVSNDLKQWTTIYDH